MFTCSTSLRIELLVWMTDALLLPFTGIRELALHGRSIGLTMPVVCFVRPMDDFDEIIRSFCFNPSMDRLHLEIW
jgi:hypothetical protein